MSYNESYHERENVRNGIQALLRTNRGHMANDEGDPWLADALRAALNHLYDSAYLRKSPLVDWLSLRNDGSPAAALRTRLVAAIEALKPSPQSPVNARNRRRYRVLHYRYVQQFTQVDVAQKLAMSPRHLRREQDAALRMLAGYVRDRYGLSDAHPHEQSASEDTETEATSEVPWLGAAAITKPLVAIGQCLELSQPLADRYGVTLCLEDEGDDVVVTMAHTVLKQVLLNLISAAIRKAPHGQVVVSVSMAEDRARIEVTARADSSDQSGMIAWESADVAISEDLVARCGGRIEIRTKPGQASAGVELPLAQQYLVLAIEDNADTLRLWDRYVQASSFRLVAVRDPLRALDRAVSIEPQIIVLDVMLPGIDGWELLAQLQQHPITAAIPVIICTVHPQRELAYSLGASGFVRKPTTRQAFLDALQRQIEGAGPVPSRE